MTIGIHHRDSRDLSFIADGTVALTLTSPMYLNAGIAYSATSDVMPLEDYLFLHNAVWRECFRVTEPGGRIAVVVANMGRDPYFRLDALHAELLNGVGFIDRGSVIWDKGPVFGTAWGSWRRPTAPQLRDRHESILVFQKPGRKASHGTGDISADDFCAATQSLWTIPPASAKKARHPAPFPEEIPTRLIALYTYQGDMVLDPFCGSGTTCVAAERRGRRWIGVDVDPGYCSLAERNIADVILLADAR